MSNDHVQLAPSILSTNLPVRIRYLKYGIRVELEEGVNSLMENRIISIIKIVTDRFIKISPVHPLTFLVRNSNILVSHSKKAKKKACIGLFNFWDFKQDCLIELVGNIEGYFLRLPFEQRFRSANYKVYKIVDHTVIHELCHYRQFSMGQSITERGVEQKAAAIMRKATEHRKRLDRCLNM